MSKITVVLLVVSCLGFSAVLGELKCYSCIMDGAATDTACMDNPEGVSSSNPIVKCPYKYCTIIRQEYQDPPGQIYTFYRGCTSRSTQSVQEGGGFKVYTRVCTSNLCNDWDGISAYGSGSSGGSSGGSNSGSSGGQGSSFGDPGYDGVLIVKGTGSGASAPRNGLTAALVAVVVNVFLYLSVA
ncbi:uncharacterized protein [Periplaneta americana]|uniref:uncharacterized protein n=1 Tax=Periplaneta americana TaxID=6978 RepID=UPI0037E8D71E